MSEPDYLVIEIHGRQAIPVRAIPYVSGWLLKPGTLASLFASSGKAVHSKLGAMTAYRLIRGEPSAMLPKEWDAVEVRLAALKAELYGRYPDQDEDAYNQGYAVWRTESPSCLPAGVFVWRDEFEACFKEDFSPKAHSFLEDERAGERDLIYNPLPSETPWEMILEGFPIAGHAETIQHTTSPKSVHDADQPVAEAARLRMGLNSKVIVDAYIGKRAREIHAAGEKSTMQGIAEIIASEMHSQGYRGERGSYLKWQTVVRKMPAGLTGGYRKNGRKPPRN